MANDAPKPWTETPLTGRLVLADGTVIAGQGLGATGSAVGEVCFNTAMTGYQEILTDPSYAGQIITFTFPHIGNVGTNREDTETSNLAMRSGVRGCVLRAEVTEPSNYRAAETLDQWLKARGIIAITGVDTRALTARIREKGMPNGVIAHEPSGQFDLDKLKAEAKGLAGAAGARPGARGDGGPELHLGRDALGLGQGLRPAGGARAARGGGRLRPQAQHPALPGDGGVQGDGRARPPPAPRRSWSASPTACSSPTVRAIPAATGKYAVPEIKKLIDLGAAGVRHLPRPPDAGPGARRQDHARCIRATTAPIIRSRTSRPARSRSPP